VPYRHHPAIVNRLGSRAEREALRIRASHISPTQKPRAEGQRAEQEREKKKGETRVRERMGVARREITDRATHALINQAESKVLELGRRVKTTIHESTSSLSLSSNIPPGPARIKSLSSHPHSANPPPIPTISPHITPYLRTVIVKPISPFLNHAEGEFGIFAFRWLGRGEKGD